MTNEFTARDIEAFRPNEQVALVATVNPEGKPHISLLTSLLAMDGNHMALGECSAGLSKVHMQIDHRCGFLIMTLDRKLWRGRARWTSKATEGPEYEMFNRMPMFRYNTYFGINTVHYLDLVDTTGEESLPLGAIVRGALGARLAKGGASTGSPQPVLNNMAMEIFNRLDSLKFLSYINGQGYPVIIPVLPCQAADSTRLVLPRGGYGDELALIPEGANVAVFGLTLQMEDVLVRGIFNGFSRYRGMSMGTVDVDWVYNSMPPVHGQVYPVPSLAEIF